MLKGLRKSSTLNSETKDDTEYKWKKYQDTMKSPKVLHRNLSVQRHQHLSTTSSTKSKFLEIFESHTRFYIVAPTQLLWLVKWVVSPTYLSVSMCVKEIWSNNSLSNVLAHTVKAGHIVGLAEGASRVSNEMASWPRGHQLSCFVHPCHFKSDA